MTKYDDLMRGLRQGKILPVYLFFGDEEFLIQEAVSLILAKTVDPASQDFNFNTVYCKGTSGSEIVNLAQTLPFMSERRTVIAKEVEALKAADLEELVAYLKDPSPSTCLILLVNQPRFEKKSVINAVESQGAVTRFFALLDREIIPWISGWAKAKGLTIQNDAAQYVWQTLGNDLQAINNELEKTAVSLKDRKSITLDDVKSVVGDFRDFTSFDLAEAVGRKNRERAFLVLGRLIQEGEQPVGLLGSIAWNYRRIMRAKSLEAAGVGYDEIKRKLNIIFHQSAAFQDQMRRNDLQELQGAFGALLDADRALKSGSLNGRLVLERLVLRLCGI
ncbi:MAG: DNA polymerase III subunit delta [Nitrospirota bacterium]|nr:DNA polymerase III subunit delta [Nitrospirota bacterium]